MKSEISENEVIGNDLSFRLPGRSQRGLRVNARKLLMRFIAGYIVIAGALVGARCTFFINANYAEGVVTDIKKSPRGYSFEPHVIFTAGDGKQVSFAAAQNLRVKPGERVNVIYKSANPNRAAVYSFFGFWFNSILVCQVLVLFWVGLLVVYYGDYP